MLELVHCWDIYLFNISEGLLGCWTFGAKFCYVFCCGLSIKNGTSTKTSLYWLTVTLDWCTSLLVWTNCTTGKHCLCFMLCISMAMHVALCWLHKNALWFCVGFKTLLFVVCCVVLIICCLLTAYGMSDNEGLQEYEEVQTELRKKEEEEVSICYKDMYSWW